MSWFELNKDAVLISARVADKTQALERASRQLSLCYGLDYDVVLAQILARESEGSTGFGRGVAIPHGKIPNLRYPVAAILRIDEPVDFDAVDLQPVDIIFAMLSPEAAGAMHLQALAYISRTTRKPQVLKNIRGAQHSDGIFALINEEFALNAS